MAEEKSSSILKLSIVPVVLGLAATVWFAFFRDVHVASRESSQEDRHSEIVGAKPLPQEKIRLDVMQTRSSCGGIDRAEINGGEVWVYWRYSCSDSGNVFMQVQYKAKSPDGTILLSDYHWILAGAPVSKGDHGEFRFAIKDDPRIASLALSVRSDAY